MVAFPHSAALRGAVVSVTGDPFKEPDHQALSYEADGLILIDHGRITAVGDYSRLRHDIGSRPLTHYPNALLMPGFIDAHVHYPQTQIIGAYGAQLIEWLEQYTFVAEQQFADERHARAAAELFLRETLRAGTTTAAVFCTSHPTSVEAYFGAAEKLGVRTIAGKVMMDRNAPTPLLDTAQSGYDDSQALIEKWHGKGRLSYAVTPRFAPTSTPAQLEAAGALWQRHPGTYMQTHLSENQGEIDWVRELFPERDGYLDVYAHYGLLGPRAVFGHAIHLTETEWQTLAHSGSAVTHCPSSNGFLGSGLFDFARALDKRPGQAPVRTGLATDVGAGTSLSMLRIMGEAYKIGQLGGYSLSATKALYLATHGAARALYLDEHIGTLEAGKEADIVVLDLRSTPLIDFRMKHCDSIEEALFIQMTMADDRAVKAVYVDGRLTHERDAAPSLP